MRGKSLRHSGRSGYVFGYTRPTRRNANLSLRSSAHIFLLLLEGRLERITLHITVLRPFLAKPLTI